MTSLPFDDLPQDVLIKLNNLCDEFEQTWAQSPEQIESMISQFEPRFRSAVAAEFIGLESELRHAAGESVHTSDYVDRFPQIDPATLSVLVTSSLHDDCASAAVLETDNLVHKPSNEGSSLTALRRELLAAAICTDSEITQLVDAAPKSDDEATVIIRALRDESRITSYQADILAGELSGTLSLGEYTLLEQLGSGGMGRVFKAFHRRMHRIVVVKLLHKELQEDQRFRRLFEREVFATARLSHPNIVTAFDAGESDGVLYLVTEYVAARDLSRVVREDGPLSIEQAVDVVRQAATALQYAHDQGVVHRDVKPSNLLFEPNGTVKLLDLGLSRLTSGIPEQEASATLHSKTVLGTAEYMAPEQAVDGSSTDHRSDIYSLGCTLFALLAGRPCYPADTPIARVLAHRDSPIPSLTKQRDDVPKSLNAIFRRMVAKEPDDRFQSMTELLQATDEVVAQPIPKSKPVSVRKVAVISIAIGVAVLGIAFMDGLFDRDVSAGVDKNAPLVAALEPANPAFSSDNPEVAAELQGPRMATSPFSAAIAEAVQQDWAEHLGVEVAFKDEVTGIDFVLVPPGSFRMGSTEEEVLRALAGLGGGADDFERDCIRSEQPKRTVTIHKPFYLARTETTFGQFKRFADASGYETVAERDPNIGYGRPREKWTQQGGHYHWMDFGGPMPTPNHPVSNLTFIDATEFCRHYSKPLERIHYRLPTEAEWEYACRAGTDTDWSFGGSNNDLSQFAVNGTQGRVQGVAQVVGSRKPNNFGLFDMHGNVREWCSDAFDWHDEELFERVVADQGHMVSRQSIGVTRGGSTNVRPPATRSAARTASVRANYCVSFRVVLEISLKTRPHAGEQ